MMRRSLASASIFWRRIVIFPNVLYYRYSVGVRQILALHLSAHLSAALKANFSVGVETSWPIFDWKIFCFGERNLCAAKIKTQPITKYCENENSPHSLQIFQSGLLKFPKFKSLNNHGLPVFGIMAFKLNPKEFRIQRFSHLSIFFQSIKFQPCPPNFGITVTYQFILETLQVQYIFYDQIPKNSVAAFQHLLSQAVPLVFVFQQLQSVLSQSRSVGRIGLGQLYFNIAYIGL